MSGKLVGATCLSPLHRWNLGNIIFGANTSVYPYDVGDDVEMLGNCVLLLGRIIMRPYEFYNCKTNFETLTVFITVRHRMSARHPMSGKLLVR